MLSHLNLQTRSNARIHSKEKVEHKIISQLSPEFKKVMTDIRKDGLRSFIRPDVA